MKQGVNVCSSSTGEKRKVSIYSSSIEKRKSYLQLFSNYQGVHMYRTPARNREIRCTALQQQRGVLYLQLFNRKQGVHIYSSSEGNRDF
jgi:uncharacterized protein YxeA